MSNLRLCLACGDYDRTLALRDGRVRPEGVDLVYLNLPPAEIFWRMLKYGEFDASEMSLSSYITERCSPNPRLIAIPVFPSRLFRHSYIFVNKKAGIKEPADLKGKKIGVPEYVVTAAVWIRGMLQHEYGVAPTDVKWFTGGKEGLGRQNKTQVMMPKDLNITQVPGNKALSDMLANGELDAILGPMQPESFITKRSKVDRLFPKYKKVEQQYYEKTKIFPIMHTLVIKKEVYEANPWVAQSLMKAFVEAKNIGVQNIKAGKGASNLMLPWATNEYESTVELMGDDFWPYGIEANRPTLEAITAYSYEQGLSDRKFPIAELFAPSTREVDVKKIVH